MIKQPTTYVGFPVSEETKTAMRELVIVQKAGQFQSTALTPYQEKIAAAKRLTELNGHARVTIGVFHNVVDNGFGEPLYQGKHCSHSLECNSDEHMLKHIVSTTASADYRAFSTRKRGYRLLFDRIVNIFYRQPYSKGF